MSSDHTTCPTERLKNLARTSLRLLLHAAVLQDEAEARNAELARTRAAVLRYQRIVLKVEPQ